MTVPACPGRIRHVNTRCLVVGHTLGVVTETAEEAMHWTCKRCGFTTYPAPSEVPPDLEGGHGWFRHYEE